MAATIRLQHEDFDAAAEAAKIARGRTDIGAVVTFAGICRDHEGGEGVTALTLEHYPGMAEEEITRHVAEAEKRWPLLGVTVIHRYGRLVPGDNIVLLFTARASSAETAFYPLPAGSFPHDVAPALDGAVWYSDQGRGLLGRLDPTSGKVEEIPLGPNAAPHGVIVGPDGAAWITEGGQN